MAKNHELTAFNNEPILFISKLPLLYHRTCIKKSITVIPAPQSQGSEPEVQTGNPSTTINIIFPRLQDFPSILMMVAAEEGISILPDYCTNKLINADNLVFIPLVGDEEVEEVVAMWKKENENKALQRFLEYI